MLDVVARRSSRVELATTSTPGTARGSAAQSSAPGVARRRRDEHPAVHQPDRTAAASVSDAPKLHDITATAGRCAFRATQSIPASSDDSVATPLQSSTFTDRTCACGATPCSRGRGDPGDDRAVAVAVVGGRRSTALNAGLRARPPNSGCVVSTPVSST